MRWSRTVASSRVARPFLPDSLPSPLTLPSLLRESHGAGEAVQVEAGGALGGELVARVDEVELDRIEAGNLDDPAAGVDEAGTPPLVDLQLDLVVAGRSEADLADGGRAVVVEADRDRGGLEVRDVELARLDGELPGPLLAR